MVRGGGDRSSTSSDILPTELGRNSNPPRPTGNRMPKDKGILRIEPGRLQSKDEPVPGLPPRLRGSEIG